MPVHKIGPNFPTNHPDLVDQIVTELRAPTEHGSIVGLPYIVEETINQGPALHLLVIWDKWTEVAMEDRGRVIMEAYEQSYGPDYTKNITMVMGLTYAEANKLKVGPSEIEFNAQAQYG